MEKSVLRSNHLSVDEAIHKTGDFGKYQLIQLILLSSVLFIASMPVFMMYFAAHNPPWECVANTTCTKNGSFSPGDSFYDARCRMKRDEWKYTLQESYSMVTQFGLYCDKEWIIHLLKSIVFVGWAFGAIILGAVGDKFGRRKVLIVSVFGIFVTSICMVFAPNVWLLVALQFMRGFFKPGVTVIAFIMASEIVGCRWRPLSGISLWVAWTLVLCILGVKAYLMREWKKLLLVCTVPYAPVLIGVLFVPESIRWLRLQGREGDAVGILEKMGRVNKKPLEKISLTPITHADKNVKSTYLDIVRPFSVLWKSAIQWFAWLSCGLVYYGVTFASDDLGGSMYRDYILSSLVELPAIFSAIYFCHRLGRKPTIAYPMFVTAITLVVVSLISEDSNVKFLRVVFGMIGKFCISVSFDAIYTWSVELYPTAIRSKGMGALQVAARIGSTAAPWIAKSLRVVHVTIPFIVMAVFSLATGIVLLWLPETRGKCTMETMDDLDSKSGSTDEAVLLACESAEEKKEKKKEEAESDMVDATLFASSV